MDHAFYPLTLPITVGPGCISIDITLGARFKHEAGPIWERGYISALLGMFALCLLLLSCYSRPDRLVKVLGRSGTTILTRRSAFILLADYLGWLARGYPATSLRLSIALENEDGTCRLYPKHGGLACRRHCRCGKALIIGVEGGNMQSQQSLETNDQVKHVVLVGGGFAGLHCAKKLAKHPDLRVTLIDKSNYQQFQPLPYEFFGTPGAGKYSYPLCSVRDAEALRSRTIAGLESADSDPSLVDKGALSFVIVGTRPTGSADPMVTPFLIGLTKIRSTGTKIRNRPPHSVTDDTVRCGILARAFGIREQVLEEKGYIRVLRRLGLWRTALLVFLIASIPTGAIAGKPQPATAFVPAENKSTASGNLWAPFGLHTDDLNVMVKRRNIRALVLINPIGFFYDNGQPMGIMYDALSALETYVNQKFKTGALKIQVSFIPVRPDQAEAALTQGVGDFVAYSLVVTPQRQQQVAFTVPLKTNAQQVLVTRPNFGTVTSLDDLGGKEIYANPLTVQYQVLQDVNDKLKKAGKPLIVIKAADRYLLEDDLVEMVNAGLLPATVIEVSRAKLWAQVLHNLTVHPEPVLASGEQTAWALRKNNPQLKQLLDEFIAPRAVGSSFGNTLVRRYLENTRWVVNSTSPQEIKKFEALSSLFKKYAGQYDFDYSMMMAQGYQESTLEQSMRSPGGAVGIMQVMPRDAAASPINVPNVWTAEGNIHAGIKILHTIEEKYLSDPKLDPLNKTLLAFASYNAGSNRIARLREQAPKEGLDPNVWFGNMELMVARNIGQVTVTYVGNVYKYYVAYKMALQQPGPGGRLKRQFNPSTTRLQS